jgi:hypothetical protein
LLHELNLPLHSLAKKRPNTREISLCKRKVGKQRKRRRWRKEIKNENRLKEM